MFRRPVEQVSWTMIMEPDGFAARTGMRLPTEAEWEYAYRAGGLSAYHGFPANPNSTDDALRAGRIAWSASNSDDQTHPVGELGGNGFGLHDMSGNVSEWVVDNYAADYYSQSPLLDPPGPRESHVRCLRGGSWWSTSWHIRASCRGSSYPYARDSTTGFRVARDP